MSKYLADVTVQMLRIVAGTLKITGAGIADGGGTNRITLSTTTPFIAMVGNTNVEGKLVVGSGTSDPGGAVVDYGHAFGGAAGGATIVLNVGASSGASGDITTSKTTIRTNPTWSIGGSTITLTGVQGNATFSLPGSAAADVTAIQAYGLDFVFNLNNLSSTKKLTATTVYAIKAQPKSSSVSAGLAAVTDWGGLWILPSVVASTNISITRQVGIWINYAGTNRAVTNVGVDIDATTATGGITTGNYGIRAGDVSGVATKARIMELGAAAAPYMLVKGSGEWTAAANETPVWIIENATLRQMKTIVETGLNIATGTKLIAYLV